MANQLVQARVDKEIKDEAAIVLAAMGLTVSDAVRLLLTRVAREKELPFAPLVPTAETISAMKEARPEEPTMSETARWRVGIMIVVLITTIGSGYTGVSHLAGQLTEMEHRLAERMERRGVREMQPLAEWHRAPPSLERRDSPRQRKIGQDAR